MAHLPIDSHALRASSILLPGLATVHLDSFQPCPWTYFLRFAGLFGAEYSEEQLQLCRQLIVAYYDRMFQRYGEATLTFRKVVDTVSQVFGSGETNLQVSGVRSHT